jgi:hypothetical protein
MVQHKIQHQFSKIITHQQKRDHCEFLYMRSQHSETAPNKKKDVVSQDANGPVRFGPVIGPSNLEEKLQVKVWPGPPFIG